MLMLLLLTLLLLTFMLLLLTLLLLTLLLGAVFGLLPHCMPRYMLFSVCCRTACLGTCCSRLLCCLCSGCCTRSLVFVSYCWLCHDAGTFLVVPWV